MEKESNQLAKYNIKMEDIDKIVKSVIKEEVEISVTSTGVKLFADGRKYVTIGLEASSQIVKYPLMLSIAVVEEEKEDTTRKPVAIRVGDNYPDLLDWVAEKRNGEQAIIRNDFTSWYLKVGKKIYHKEYDLFFSPDAHVTLDIYNAISSVLSNSKIFTGGKEDPEIAVSTSLMNVIVSDNSARLLAEKNIAVMNHIFELYSSIQEKYGEEFIGKMMFLGVMFHVITLFYDANSGRLNSEMLQNLIGAFRKSEGSDFSNMYG